MKAYTKVITHKIMFVNFAAAASLGWRFFEGFFSPIFGAGLTGVFTYTSSPRLMRISLVQNSTTVRFGRNPQIFTQCQFIPIMRMKNINSLSTTSITDRQFLCPAPTTISKSLFYLSVGWQNTWLINRKELSWKLGLIGKFWVEVGIYWKILVWNTFEISGNADVI